MNSVSLAKEKKSAFTEASKHLQRDSSSDNVRENENRTNKQNKRKMCKQPKSRGIIYIGRIPHGFYEDEMRAYFNQFGTVIATAVARSKKTGRSRGYGFVEFKDQEVAKIAAETMNNYLMFNRIIKCKYIPPEERKKRVFPGTISTSNYPRKKNRIITSRNNKKLLSNMNQASYLKKVQKKVNEFKKFFEEKGIEFTFHLNKENSESNESLKSDENKTKQLSEKLEEPKSDEDSENQIGILEIDESDHDISFKTPPQVKKVIKKSSTASKKDALSKKLQEKKEIKVKQLKNKSSIKIQEKEKLEKKSDAGLRDNKKKTEVKLAQPGKTKTKVAFKEDLNSKNKQKNLKFKGISELKNSKKGKLPKNKSTKIQANKVKKASRKIKINIKK